MPRPKKDATTRKQRVTFARRVQAVIHSRYGTLYQFQQRHPDLAGRVETWTLPQRKRRLTIADFDSIVVPDGLSLRAFCTATGVSADWLLGLRGTDEGVEFTTVARPVPSLADELAEYVRVEVEARVARNMVEGFVGWTAGQMLATPDAGERLLGFAVDAAEQALRAWYPVETQRRVVDEAIADVRAVAAQQPLTDEGDRTHAALRNAQNLLPSMLPTPPAVPLAQDPPIRFKTMARVSLVVRRSRGGQPRDTGAKRSA